MNGHDGRGIAEGRVRQRMKLEIRCVGTAAGEPRRIANLVRAPHVLNVALQRFHDRERLRLNVVMDRGLNGVLATTLLHKKEDA